MTLQSHTGQWFINILRISSIPANRTEAENPIKWTADCQDKSWYRFASKPLIGRYWKHYHENTSFSENLWLVDSENTTMKIHRSVKNLWLVDTLDNTMRIYHSVKHLIGGYLKHCNNNTSFNGSLWMVDTEKPTMKIHRSVKPLIGQFSKQEYENTPFSENLWLVDTVNTTMRIHRSLRPLIGRYYRQYYENASFSEASDWSILKTLPW